MSEQSKIEWTDATWNPILGCDKISPGCKNCYAIRTAHRLQSNPNPKVAKAFEGLTVIQGGQPNWTGRVNFVEERLEEPHKWRLPRRVFVNSQSDLFHEGLTDRQIAKVFQVMFTAKQHTYQVLTKRPERMKAFLSNCGEWQGFITHNGHPPSSYGGDGIIVGAAGYWPLRNVWLGVSCENQETADERIPLLLQTPAAVRWVSAEPLLGPLTLRGHMMSGENPALCRCGHGHGFTRCPNYGHVAKECHVRDCECKQFQRVNFAINWVVCGGESGPNARPMHPDWARGLRDQCQAAGVPFFFKQWGEWAPHSGFRPPSCVFIDGKLLVNQILPPGTPLHSANGAQWMRRVGKKAAGRLLDGKEWNEYPAVHG